jgi:Ring finger domain
MLHLLCVRCTTRSEHFSNTYDFVFAIRTQAVMDLDVSNEKTNRKKHKKVLSGADQGDDDDEIPMDAVAIPGLSPTGSYGDVESASAAAVLPGTTATSPNSSQPTSPASSRSRTNTGESSDNVYSSPNYDDYSDLGSEDHMDQRSCNASTLGDDSSGKGLKKVESYDGSTEDESFTTVTSEYAYDVDDSTSEDNVCPICLSGYEKGDTIFVSKHCTHCFHKDCILEWLEKHDDCPICRVNMVTESEMSRAATSLVGEMRMYRAVASMQTSSPSPTIQRYQMHPHLHAAANVSRGTVRFSQGLHVGMV